MNRRERQLEEALLEYIQLYGLRDKARVVFESANKENKANIGLLILPTIYAVLI